MDGNTIPIPLNDVACQALMLSRSVVHHGNLRKRGMLNNWAEKVNVIKPLNLDQVIRWRQYYVVLINGCIYIYNNEMSSKPTHATSLFGFKGVELCDYEVPFGISWPFKLVSADENKDPCYYFSAPSERDLQIWIECIKDQLLKLPGPKLVERRAFTTPTTPYKAEFRRTVGSSPPPLPPPRGSAQGLEYYTVSNAEEHESTEIPEEATGVTKVAVSLLKSQSRTRFANSSFSVEGSGQPQAQSHRASMAVSYDNNLDSQKTIRPTPPIKPLGSNASSKRNTSVDLSITNESSMPYAGAPYYLELDKEAQLQKIETEAFWNGRPDDADVIMTHVTHNGAYMLRESSEKGTRTLLVRVGSSVVKYKILVDQSGRQSLLVAGPHFDTLASLIVYYKSHSIPIRDVPLTLPYSAVESTFN